jgi:hypothetical protein
MGGVALANQTAPSHALPNLVLIGAMKCGTSALHSYLDLHPEITMSQPKELNFFFGPMADGRPWTAGNSSRGLGWYARHFPARAPVRGESSPGYTSPAHPRVAQRMAATIPAARLIYLVRDPIARALSHYRHHHAEGQERRPLPIALLDPASQYISRGRYYERLLPFTAHFRRPQILVVAQEDLRDRRVATLRRVFAFAGVDVEFWCDAFAADDDDASRCGSPEVRRGSLDAPLRDRLADAFRADAARLRAFAGHPLPAWSV